MQIGAAWKKETSAGKTFLSVKIDVPFLGPLNFALFKNDEKKSDRSPDYVVSWMPPRDGGSSSSSSDYGDTIPF